MKLPSTHSRHTTIALGIAGVVLTTALVVAGGFVWLVVHERALAIERGEALNKRISDTVVLAQTRTTLLETASIRNRLNSYFIQERNEVVFIEELESLGNQAGVSITFSSIEKRTEDPSPELHVSFSTEGLWQNTMHFTALLESLPRKITIQHVSFSEISNTEGPSRWHGSFDISLESFAASPAEEN